MGQFLKFFPSKSVGVCAGYKEGYLVAAVAAVTLRQDDGLVLEFPQRNPFAAGDPITVHLDDRVGSELFSIELRVYRTSFKGTVVSADGNRAQVTMADYELYLGSQVVVSSRSTGYVHPVDARPSRSLAETPLRSLALVDDNEKSNQLGVLVTRALVRPHTTVMAFLTSVEDDIFLITDKTSFKFQLLGRDPECVFALDHRATFSFERHVDWNYTIFETRAYRVDRGSPLFDQIQAEFVKKNPWEIGFFSSPLAEMIHLVPRRIIHQDILCL
jgi:hypothetical protein